MIFNSIRLYNSSLSSDFCVEYYIGNYSFEQSNKNQTVSKTNKTKMDLSLRLKTNNFLSGSKSSTADFFFYGISI